MRYGFETTRRPVADFPAPSRARRTTIRPPKSLRVLFMRLLLPPILLLALAAPIASQGRTAAAADWTPLGGIGASGEAVTTDAGFVFRLGVVAEDGPAARAGLVVGDAIVSLGGKKLPGKGDPVLRLHAAVEAAEAKSGALKAVVVRKGGSKKETLTIPVEVLGPYARREADCARLKAIRDRAVDFLVTQQSRDGSFPTQLGGDNGLVVVSSLAGLALLGAGGHDDAVAKCRDWVCARAGAESRYERMRPPGGANWNQSNWQLGYAPFFLTAFAQDRKVREKLVEIAARLAKNQEATGGYAHGPGGPNALDYLELEIVSNYALAALGLIRDAGIAVDEEKVSSGIAYIVSCTSGGGVSYSTRRGQFGAGDPGRTAGAWFAMHRNARGRSKTARQMLKYFAREMDKLPTGHVSPTMHILAGAIASRYGGGSKLWTKFWREYRPYIMSTRLHGGAFGARPTAETRALRSNTDRTLGAVWTTASFVIVLNLAIEKDPYPHFAREPVRE